MKITIVGSIYFLEKFKEAKKFLESKGHQIIIPEKDPEPISIEIKRKAMERFNENIKNSDAILVMNYTKNDKENYIGVNTLMEIGMGFILDKKIYLLNPIPEFCKDELRAINPEILNGDFGKI